TINKIIESRREVAKSRWKFFQVDIAHSISEIPEVDLIIALNGGDVLKNAFEKAKKKGHVLTASEFSGEGFIKSDARFGHLLNIGFQSGEYRTLKEERKQKKKGKAFTKDNVFRDTLEYSLYQKLH